MSIGAYEENLYIVKINYTLFYFILQLAQSDYEIMTWHREL